MVSLTARFGVLEDVMEIVQPVQDIAPDPLFALRASRDPGDAGYFVVCLQCGQGFDRRNLAHALYHAEADHDPFLVEDWSQRLSVSGPRTT